ncbi:hypothetical protein BTA51_20160 [Hahella sp. CCB-MM4]|uniref:DUF3291 domain-containing protein n=1 Tax=Hahella sp. (strain CCB-MM4) TaxID=1926491 RepID=UPI000B9C02B5|nr:DUF3291 domain-containing protein [Hahella sp. CCB-MM4]OZG71595.1 hypothetical protein BTA51_20160 [Hahella sp. CCB-MM4]
MTDSIHYYLAQINVGQLLAPQDDPRLVEFIDNLDRINSLAEQSPGFIWRLKDDSGNAMSFQVFDNPQVISNISVWKDIESLRTFVYDTQHLEFVKRRKEWFELMKRPQVALWWVPANHRPTLKEGAHKLEILETRGPSPEAFTFAQNYPIPEESPMCYPR